MGSDFGSDQCRRCQKWGHGTKNCHMDAKCMICGGSSHAKDVCPVKEDTTKFICSNCGANHKSNFWNCPSRKRVIEARARQMKDNIRYDYVTLSASDFNFLTEQLNLMIDAMFKATTMTEAVQVGVKYTNQIVIGLRFSNGSK